MISSDESSSDNAVNNDSRRNQSVSVKLNKKHLKPEMQGKDMKSKVDKSHAQENASVVNVRDKKKMCKSDFIKSNTESSLDSDSILDISPMKKQKMTKRKMNCFSHEVHSSTKKTKMGDSRLDKFDSSLSEDNEPSVSQKRRKIRKMRDRYHLSLQTNHNKGSHIESSSHTDTNDDLNSENVDVENENSSDDEEEEEFAAIKKELAEMSFEERVKLRDKVGIKVYNQIVQGEKKVKSEQKKTFKRENKNRPVEISSKKKTSVLRNTIPVKKKIIRDPRFDDLSGEFNEHLFKQSYGFIDEIKAKEKQKLEKQLKKEKDEKKKENIKYLLGRMKQQEIAEKKKKERENLEKQWKKKELQMVNEGKTPFFLKKGDLKKLELAEKFKELQKSGKLDNYLSKKRKKNASKEKKKLPI